MIPVRLQMTDFLSYADPEPLDFTFDVACLSGPNGVGKSSILDAMTWSLFGAARGCEGGQNQDRLIRDGADQCTVGFTFDLSGARYRITRMRPRKGSGQVRFEVADGEGWRNIAAETLKQTESKIGELLRMDYTTFTASAFFLQGRSEDFLVRLRPDERKEVLARLLDLGVYDKLEAAARDRARSADAHRKEIATTVERLTEDQLDTQAIERDIASTDAQLGGLKSDGEAAAKVLEAAQKDLGAVEAQAELLRRARADLGAHQRDHADWTQRIDAKRKELEALDALVARRDEVAAAVKELDDVRASEAKAREAHAKAAALERERADNLAQIASDERSLKELVSTAQQRLTQLTAERDELAGVDDEIAAIDASIAESQDPKGALDDARAQLREHELGSTRFTEQMRALDEKVALSNESLTVLAAGGGECPVCAAPLDAKHRAQAKKRLQAEIKAAKADKQTIAAQLETETKEAKRCGEEIARLESSVTERDALGVRRSALTAKLERRPVLDEETAKLSAALEQTTSALRDETFAADARAAVVRLTAEIEAAYNPDAHEALRRRIAELEPYATLAGQIEQAVTQREALVGDINAGDTKIGELVTSIEAKTADVAVLEKQVGDVEGAQRAVGEAQATLEALRAAYVEVREILAMLNERLTLAGRLAAELTEARTAEADAALQHRRYRRLVEAFGRGGIPDLIIDNAIPELEDEANAILGRLSDHEMSVHFVLQRDTKSGKAKDTFEALVHHDGGVRDFAMFSGGEAFRVAFAVRLAMSKLLVRRAGARLETLVIDEGFGTQDPEGRERLVEAINLARTEFAKILVITHLDDLKDQFGTQIQVSKGPEGSRIAVAGG